MMVAHYHVATVPPLFQNAHAIARVSKVSHSATSCRIPNEEEFSPLATQRGQSFEYQLCVSPLRPL